MGRQVHEALINYAVWYEGREIATVDVALPPVASMTVDVRGSGISGVVNSPVLGHTESATMKMTFRTVTGEARDLLRPIHHQIQLWGAIQRHDDETGQYVVGQHKLIVTAIPKNYTTGTMAVASLQGTELEFEVIRQQSFIDDVEEYRINKYGGIDNRAGDDVTSAVWRATGRM